MNNRIVRTTNPPRNPRRAGFVRSRNTQPYIKTSHHLSFDGDVSRDRAKWSNFNAQIKRDRANWNQYAGNGMMTQPQGIPASTVIMGYVNVAILFFIIGWAYNEGKKAA
mgnify:FL=1|tara:strand:+ start:582 stop:908 length:327 start_codon:yes stop_codon:yes gene_type:complete